MDLDTVLLWLHVMGNIVWIGAILAVGLAITAVNVGDESTRGKLATAIYLRLAAPAFVVSFACGAIRLALHARFYLVEHHWMHGKLSFGLAAIALHHVIGARAKRLARGNVQGAGPTAILTGLLAVSAAAAAFFAIFKLPG
jgi:protoporphyrinogen IX oxidase